MNKLWSASYPNHLRCLLSSFFEALDCLYSGTSKQKSDTFTSVLFACTKTKRQLPRVGSNHQPSGSLLTDVNNSRTR